MKTNIATPLPKIQKAFIRQFDGSIESIASFADLHLVLNPVFSMHYFYISGTTSENTITTRHTDGSFAYWGSQTETEMTNAFMLADELKAIILATKPQRLDSVMSENDMRKVGKISRVRNRAAIVRNDSVIMFRGITL